MDFDNDFYEDIHFRQYRIIEQDYEANAFFRNLHFAFTVVMVHLIAFYLSFYIIGTYIHPHDFSWLRMDTDTEDEKMLTDIPFEEKYLEKLKDMDETELTEEKLLGLEKCVLIENTPNGNVIMLYNAHDESFWYFCDDKSVSFKYLETVLRHYVIVYDCKSLYKNKSEQLEKLYEKEKMKREHEQMQNEEKNALDEDDSVEKDSESNTNESETNESNTDESNTKETQTKTGVTTTSVFANFKKSRIRNTKKEKNNTDKDSKVEKNDDGLENMEHMVKSNRFSYKGKICNYEIIKKQLESGLPKLDFKTFMKMQKEKEEKQD